MKLLPRKHLRRKPWSNRRRIVPGFALVLAAVSVLFIGCPGSTTVPPPASTAPSGGGSKSTAAAANTPALSSGAEEKSKAQAEYTYKPTGRRDPFAPIIEREERAEQRFALPPLERFAVAEFKLTGIVWGGFGFNAIMEGPDGKGYFVRKGTVIGVNHGKVKKITSDALIIEETFKNYMGETERKEIIVKLQKKQEGLR